MKLNKQTQTFEGELSNGVLFTLDLIKRGDSWLFGIKIEGRPSFFTCSSDFKDTDFTDFDIQNKVALQLEELGIPKEDVAHFMNQLSKVM